MQKVDRQHKLVEIVQTKSVSRQAELVTLLGRAGFDVTQTSVSRDLLELGILKVNGIYTVIERGKSEDIFGLHSIRSAGENLIVIKCGIGMASAAALKIDNGKIENIIWDYRRRRYVIRCD